MKILAVDLDRTLLRQDSTLMCLRYSLRQNAIYTITQAFRLSRSDFKKYLIDYADFDKMTWKYNKDIQIYLESRRDKEVLVFLVTGAPEKVARQVLKDVAVFSGYFCSDENVLLKFEKKAELLTEKFGTKHFDYIGDSFGDRYVWKYADRCMAPKSRLFLKIIFRIMRTSIDLELI